MIVIIKFMAIHICTKQSSRGNSAKKRKAEPAALMSGIDIERNKLESVEGVTNVIIKWLLYLTIKVLHDSLIERHTQLPVKLMVCS